MSLDRCAAPPGNRPGTGREDEPIRAFSPPLARLPTCGNTPGRLTVCPMKLRPDLVKKLTPEMLRASVEANNPRYKPEPLFSKTGTGSLSPASTDQRASEDELSTAIIQKLMSESGENGKDDGPPN